MLLRVGLAIPFADLAGQGAMPAAVTELTLRIQQALRPLTLHAADQRVLCLAQELAWLLAEAPGSRMDLEAHRLRVQGLLPQLTGLPGASFETLEARVHAAQAHLRAMGLRPDQVGHPYPGVEVRGWLPGAAFRGAVALLLLPCTLLIWPAYRGVGWLAGRWTDEGDQVATLKLLTGLLLLPLWVALLGLVAGCLWGRWVAGLPFLALLLAGLGLPTFERVAEDLQAIRGFLRRRDPAVPELLEARRELLAAFPDLAR